MNVIVFKDSVSFLREHRIYKFMSLPGRIFGSKVKETIFFLLSKGNIFLEQLGDSSVDRDKIYII